MHDADERHVKFGCIAQGLLQHLAINHPRLVWAKFRSWLRTVREGVTPSEATVAQALRASLPEFLWARPPSTGFEKFLVERVDVERAGGMATRDEAVVTANPLLSSKETGSPN